MTSSRGPTVDVTGADDARWHDEVVAIAREAGAFLRSRYGDPGTVEPKVGDAPVTHQRPYDVVTEVDYAAEALILERIRAVSNGAAIQAEEGGVCFDEGCTADNLADATDLWIIDPLDGTVNFAHSVPIFCVSIARFSRGEPVAGAIYDPMLDEMFSFARGSRALLDGQPIRAADRDELHSCVIGVGDARVIMPGGVADECRSWRRIGSAALNLAWVACGRLDAYVQFGQLAPWDYSVGVPLVLAAGGVATTPELERWTHPLDQWSGVVAAGPSVHRALAERISAS